MTEIQIRPALPSDLEALVELETRAMHFPMGHRVREWFRDDFPGDLRERFAVAEHDGRLVSAAVLVPMPFVYRGVPLMGAYWEAVVTDAAYRRRGLCRRLFEMLTPDEGLDAIFVWGATWLYHRFEYFPALRNYGGLDSTRRIVRVADLPASSLGVRDATPGDAPFLSRLRLEAGARYVVSVPVSEERWRHDLRPDRSVVGRGGTGLNRHQAVRILERLGEPVGFFAHDPWDLARLMEFEIVPGETTWREAGAAAIRATAAFVPRDDATVALPKSHPIFAALPRTFGITERAYGDVAARVPDLVVFLRRVAPALERTLAASPLAGWTGEITVSRIKDGLKLRFEGGRLVEIAPWEGSRPDEARAKFMLGRFEALVFGYRSLAAILAEDADCATDEEAEAVLAALFPPADSFLRPI